MINIKTILIVQLLLIYGLVFSEKIGSLPQLEKPAVLIVKKGKVFIADSTVKVQIYSLNDMKYVGQASGRGEGPSEMRIITRMNVDKNSIFLFGAGKCAWFSHDGTFKKELKFAVKGGFRVSPVGGNNFLCLSNSKSVGKKFTPYDLSLYNYSEKEGIQFKKLVYYYEVPNLIKSGSKYDYRVLEDTVKYCIYDDKIFIADSYRGFLVEAFDNQGEKITQFKIPLKKKAVTEEYKKKRLALLKTSPQWEQAKIMYNFVFPEFFPEFSDFTVDEDKMYFLTFNLKNDDREVIVTDLKGNLQKSVFVPLVENRMQKNFSVSNGKFYYIQENEDEEEWELLAVDLK